MSIQIESDLKEILVRIDNKLDKLSEDVTELKVGLTEVKGNIKAVDEKLSGQIKTVDEKLSGQIKAVDEKLSGQIKALDTKVDQLDKRVSNQEFTNRGVLVGLIIVILGGAAKFFGIVGNP
ncbi:MAG: hypothetical protein QNJ41_23270 [Xenococcaceae cyanobacterium MO_188.B32]|nr:hypothetical protein [Xenococcaceae cyanobacterium MO_188.B32]